MLYSNILAHARRCAPAESCGFVVRTPEGERYFPCVNISGEPEAIFVLRRKTGCGQRCRGRLWHWFTATLVVCPG
ncbi:putative tail component K-like protein [Escherichia coli O157:H7 str. G5101]|nr:putative tail component K-like protein [Escherichia coli O157:H7 str. G5101]